MVRFLIRECFSLARKPRIRKDPHDARRTASIPPQMGSSVVWKLLLRETETVSGIPKPNCLTHPSQPARVLAVMPARWSEQELPEP